MLYCNVSNLIKSTNEFTYVVNTNQYCFRDKHPLKKEPNSFRILALGDSFTFGNTVNENETYPYLLEKKLNNDNKTNFEVINFGVGGFSTTEEYIVLKDFGINYQPDLILVGFYINDFQDSLSFESRKINEKGIIEKIYSQSKFIGWIYWKIKTSFLGNKLINFLGLNSRQQEAYQFELSLLKEDLIENYGAKKAIALTSNSFKKIKSISDQLDIPLLVFYIPAKWQVNQENFEKIKRQNNAKNYELSINKPQLILSQLLLKNNIDFLDLTPSFKNQGAQQIFWEYDGHLNQKGYNLLADLLAKKIKSQEKN